MSWADAGGPDYLAAGLVGDTDFHLFGLSASGEEVFRPLLPARGHAAAAHPHHPEAVAFARRPGTFACVFDCITGREIARLSAPVERHFYGHGAFSALGDLLLTTENAYRTGEGRIGIWSRAQGYARVADIASGGIGPHDILRLPGSDIFAVANGGIRTHPGSGREQLNLDTMQPNLTCLRLDGALVDRMELATDQRRNSIRHLAVRADGTVAFAMQWQGEPGEETTLAGLHRIGERPSLLGQTDLTLARLGGYAGSVAFDGPGTQVAISSPRGGVVQIYDTASTDRSSSIDPIDVCGLSTGAAGIFCSTGTGGLHVIGDQPTALLSQSNVKWDNHIISLG